ncbi:MAG: hypothetical protein ACFFD4_20415 [Candidatus Odinarchaeota archaeon]
MDLFALDSGDYFLFMMEFISCIGLAIALVLALIVKSRYSKLASRSWLIICLGLACIVLHGIFDVLDTLKWSIDNVVDWLNIFDALFFVIGIVLLGAGIWQFAKHGAEAWGL